MGAAESASIRQRGEGWPASQHVTGAVATVLLGVGDGGRVCRLRLRSVFTDGHIV